MTTITIVLPLTFIFLAIGLYSKNLGRRTWGWMVGWVLVVIVVNFALGTG